MSRKKGISLLEVLLIIAVSAIVMVMAVGYFDNVRLTSKVNETVLQVRNLYQGSLSYYNSQKYQALTSNTNIAQDLLDGNYVTPSDLNSPWAGRGGSLISNKVVIDTQASTVTIITPALPQKACTVLSARITASFAKPTLSNCTTAANNGFSITLLL
ncbi:MAG: hypothetical protein K2Q14_00440 [Gammaproteobacteria bacterium]|nr:hypothetical protein [Gammaproteobacteria bacterium]